MKPTPKMRGIEVLPSGRFRVRITKDGKRVEAPVCDTLEAAIALREALKVELATGEFEAIDGLSVKAWGPGWLRKYRSSKRGFRSERQRFWNHVATAPFANRPMVTISRRDVKEWVHGLRTTKVKDDRRPDDLLSLQTRKHILNLLRALLQDAVEDEVIKVNPAADVRIREASLPVTDDLYLTPTEQEAVLDACGTDPERWVVQFALGTGLRQAEQWSVLVADVRVEGSDPHVVVRFGGKDKTTKSGKIRRVPLFGLGLEAAVEWLKVLPSYAPHNPEGLMFPSPKKDPDGKDGHRLYKGGARRQCGKTPPVWKKARAVVSRRIWWHLLRHTAASSLVAGWWGEKWRLEEVRQFMGHSSVKVTERYAHLAGSVLRAQATATHAAWQEQRARGDEPAGPRAPLNGTALRVIAGGA